MSTDVLDFGDPSTLEYIVTHVFCPLRLPDGDDNSTPNDCSLVRAVAAVVHHYSAYVGKSNLPQWRSISRMLDNLHAIVQFRRLDRSQTVFQLRTMDIGDVLTFLVRAQNAGVIFRRQEDVTIFEAFEVSPKAGSVMATLGKLICSYPGPAIEVPNTVFDDKDFLAELVNFLVRMNEDVVKDAVATTRKAQSVIAEERDTTHPRYITELLTGILRSVGRPAEVPRVAKRVGDDVVWNNSKLPWRRSSLWLLIRVVLQTTLERSFGREAYKDFMLFFMCYLAKERSCVYLPNDFLQAMSAKISRRLRKLGSSAPDWLSRIALEACTVLRVILEKRWTRVQAASRISPRWRPSELDLSHDTQLSLTNSQDYLRNSLSNLSISTPDACFSPRHLPRGRLEKFISSDGAFFEGMYSAEPYVALYDVEQAVEREIDGWVNWVGDNDQACTKLELLMSKYTSGALETYGSNPELLSIMLLTTIELWIALDKIAIREIPMLAEYSPEIPPRLLEELLLCRSTSLQRLYRANKYLSSRHSQANRGSIFSPAITADTFAIRYYRTSSRLQHLKTQIEEAAQRDVDRKLVQLESINASHAALKQQCIDTEHSSAINQYGREFHPKNCARCRLEKRLVKMEITVHEWPLPKGNASEVLLFELDCPVSFAMWRNVTFHILVDLCSPALKPRDPYIKLNQYEALQPYFIQHPRSRITLSSDTKPFVVTHYSKAPIPATQERVCVNNGLKFNAFDSQARIPVSEALGRVNFSKYCTYQLHDGPYKNLQKYIDGISHTSNGVLANQIDCHKDIVIHEFVSFGHLRSGGSLQWLNVLRELRSRSLTSRRYEVHMLIAQAVSQVGPISGTEWAWHRETQEPSYGEALVEELESLMRDVKANWLEGVTMDTISFILRRLLASNPSQVVAQKAFRLLRIVRGKVFSWVVELSGKLGKANGDNELRGLLRDTAAICRSTFDVDPAMFKEVICSTEDIEVLIACAILIHDNTPGKVSGLPIHSQLLLDRDRRMSLALESALKDVVRTGGGCHGIDLAISKVWPLYRAGTKWVPLQEPNSSWVSCTTAHTTGQCSQAVQFNLLDGSLLVEGKPLGRLPQTIMQHPVYNHIFGKQVLDVVPADLSGMDYSTRDAISGHQVYFALRKSGLIVRAIQAESSTIYQLVPPEMFRGDLPAVLIDEHAHWLNISKSVVEIRPLDKLWESSSENWILDCSYGQYRVSKGLEELVDIRSQTWVMVSDLLKPLDTSQNLLVTLSPRLGDSNERISTLWLSVFLPRYDLSFYVDEDGDLRSHNIRNMVYDENQITGTMFGLVSQLVLRPKSTSVDAEELIPRCVLIPDGTVSFEADGHHVRVEVDTQNCARITYQTYKIDTDLGCLTGNVSLTNKLYRVYLHALTSGCGIDPLTNRTGTEEALSLLHSANCWSIMRFSSRDAELLSLIASLCPSRTWYPEQLRSMQRVVWLSLPTNSQHPEFYNVTQGIKEHIERFQSFDENNPGPLFESFPTFDDHLTTRGVIRAAYLYPPEFSGLPGIADFDAKYASRDVLCAASGEHRAYVAAANVYCRAINPVASKYIDSLMKSWNEAEVSGATPLSLQYDYTWLRPDLPSIWLEAYNLLRKSDGGVWIQLLFCLPSMAYASPALSELVPVFVAFAAESRFYSEDPPSYDTYHLGDGYRPSNDTLRSYIQKHALSFERSPESTEPARAGESFIKLNKRQRKLYGNRLESDASEAIQQFLGAWPCETPPECLLDPDLYDVAGLMSDIESHFFSCYRNLKLKQHLMDIKNILKCMRTQAIPITYEYSFRPSQNITPCVYWSLTVLELCCGRLAPSVKAHDKLPRYAPKNQNTASLGFSPLCQLINVIAKDATTSFQRQYATSLLTSAESLRDKMSIVSHKTDKEPTAEELVAHYFLCRAKYVQALDHLRMRVGPSNNSELAIKQSGQWPRLTAYAFLRLLASTSSIPLPKGWRECLIRLALLLLEVQRARRLLQLYIDGLHEEFRKELENEGCDGWTPDQHPDWLLIQLQGNFLIRRVQVDVANEMISPRSGMNTAMQLNMGEGKSSVIVPISAAALADGDQVVRIIVPKALTTQMFQLLVDRLGGLANRRIYFLPFSRSVEINPQQIGIIREVMVECMRNHGILVVQPEHVLSLKLVTVEKQLSPAQDDEVPGLLLDLQRWLHSNSRDIMDECDEILHVRYELVYTIGLQQPVEGFPERWTTTQQILSIVNKQAAPLRARFPLGVERERGQAGSFPQLRILEYDIGRKLIAAIVKEIMDDQLPNFSFGQVRPDIKLAIQNFILHEQITHRKLGLVKEYCQGSALWGRLLHLRGLLATGILLFAFRERRWRVDYGLHPSRTMLAVPYRAKDVPAQRAEFGHPDVAILLTCLSYYYGGLNEEQLRASFEILLKQDDPSEDYDLWVRECPSVPDSLRTLSGINVKSSDQWRDHLLPLFSRNKATVDFYLSRVVFPREAKEFPSKLSCSGWDLAEKQNRLLTGFSGTNDGQYLLPLHIIQRDPDHQRGTNAKVLSYLLQPENNFYKCMGEEERRSTRGFLKVLAAQKPEIRVLLDVGAQMLDLQNRDLAKEWLTVSPNSSAAIYFSEDDELMVLTRDGGTQLLLSSPFAQQLDRCIVYLDDAHTRGTDINFPSGFCAAVTLGPGVTKDRLVQGCMRMRKLGHGHSVRFFAPLEVDRRIHLVASKGPSSKIGTIDILKWVIRETWDDIQRRAPQWAQQGMHHTSRYDVWPSFSRGQLSPEQLKAKWLQPEAKKLEDLYGSRKSSTSTFLSNASLAIRKRCEELGVLSSLYTVSMDEEQEREVIHEAEREHYVERAPRVSPAVHSLHEDVTAFAMTGIIPANSKAFRPVFQTLEATSAAVDEAYVWSPFVLASADFERTIGSFGRVDRYLRPVQWIVSVKGVNRDLLVILSPHEVSILIPIIRARKKVHLHLYTPRVTRFTKSCDDLALYSIPPVRAGWTAPSLLMDQLNLFAGQLYLTNYDAYLRLCCFLCVYAKGLVDEDGVEVDNDGFIPPRNRPEGLLTLSLTFRTTPLTSLKKLMSLRRDGMTFAQTHVGKLVDGRTLSEVDFNVASGDIGDDDEQRMTQADNDRSNWQCLVL